MNRRLAFGLGVVLSVFAGLWWVTWHSQTVVDPSDETAKAAVSGTTRSPTSRATHDDGFSESLEVHVVAAGSPVENAVVRLMREEPTALPWAPNWTDAGAQHTGKDGIVRFDAASGTWLLAVAAKGFAVLTRDLWKSDEGLTVLTLELETGSSVRGRTRDSKDVAIAPAVLRAVPLGDRIARRQASPIGMVETTTNARGEFTFDGLSSGSWRIEGESEGSGRALPIEVEVPSDEPMVLTFRRSAFLQGEVHFAEGGGASSATVTVIGSGGSSSVETGASGTFAIELPPGGYRVRARKDAVVGSVSDQVLLAPGATVFTKIALSGEGGVLFGKVSTGDGGVIAGARVIASPHDTNGTSATATSGNDGRYELRQLAPGAYDLEVLHDAWVPKTMRGLVVGHGDRLEANLLMSSFGRIDGLVFGLNGRGVSTSVWIDAARSWPKHPRVAQSDVSGAFRFERVVPQDYSIQARAQPDDLASITTLVVAENVTTPVELTVSEMNEALVEVDTGTCRAKGPITLYASRSGGSAFATNARELEEGARSAKLNVSSGSWIFGASRGQCASTMQNELVEIPQTRRIALRLEPPVEGEKVTVLERDGTPSEWASVTCNDDEGGFESRVTDANGVAELEVSQCASIAANNQGRSARAAIKKGQHAATLTLGAASRLRLQVSGASGSTVLTIVRQGEREETLTVAGNLAVLDDLPADELVLSALSADHQRLGRIKVTTRAGETVEATLALVQGGFVRGMIVIDEADRERTYLSADDGTFAVPAIDGSFELGPLMPGDQRVMIHTRGKYRPEAFQVTIKAGLTTTLNVP